MFLIGRGGYLLTSGFLNHKFKLLQPKITIWLWFIKINSDAHTMLVRHSYDNARTKWDVNRSYNDFSIGTGFWTWAKTLRWPHARWWFVKNTVTSQELLWITQDLWYDSLYILHDWPRFLLRRWSYLVVCVSVTQALGGAGNNKLIQMKTFKIFFFFL